MALPDIGVEHRADPDRPRLRQVVDRMIDLQRSALAVRRGVEDNLVGVVSALGDRCGARPAVRDDRRTSTCAYFREQQIGLLRDVAVAEHDFGKRLMIAARPLVDDASFARLWIALRNSGNTPRVRIRGRSTVEFGTPTG
ncbi:hypothetical protein [Skermania piniformis]|uniref:Uncharacterized protein n=1 Tax=Skermania pinensis TaxID=39122 RepID=A0ABX8S6Y2_9ACTN|nr:hypothetical protein [Skermania piniformis]QXQ13226.1 hypothetical protein KV203_15270 [Skermania piniformis]